MNDQDRHAWIEFRDRCQGIDQQTAYLAWSAALAHRDAQHAEVMREVGEVCASITRMYEALDGMGGTPDLFYPDGYTGDERWEDYIGDMRRLSLAAARLREKVQNT